MKLSSALCTELCFTITTLLSCKVIEESQESVSIFKFISLLTGSDVVAVAEVLLGGMVTTVIGTTVSSMTVLNDMESSSSSRISSVVKISTLSGDLADSLLLGVVRISTDSELYTVTDGDVTTEPEQGVAGDERTSTESELEATEGRLFSDAPANPLFGGVVTISLAFGLSKNDPVNEPQRAGLLVGHSGCNGVVGSVLLLVSGGDEDIISSSCISRALSICFCASLRAFFAKLASPVVSNQLILAEVQCGCLAPSNQRSKRLPGSVTSCRR